MVMKIDTTRFGVVEVDEGLIFNFISPIIGFEDAQYFVLIENDDNNIFRWLQSTQYPELAFPVSKASYFQIDYNFEIDDKTVEMLGFESIDDVLSLNIVNIPKGQPQKSTINLLAPVIINKRTKVAAQLILNGSEYLVKQPIFPQEV